MVCDCCGRKKMLFESFAAVQAKDGPLNLCVNCNNLAYKVRDDANAMDRDAYHQHLAQWKKSAKKPTERFVVWQKAFLSPLEKKLGTPDR